MGRDLRKNWVVYLMLLPVVAYFIIYCYWPMAGLVISFEDYKVRLGLFGSKWVGLKHFERFFNSMYFGSLFRNTVMIGLKDMLFSFPITIGFALLLNEVRNKSYKKLVQTVSYLPYFISMVVVCGLVKDFTEAGSPISNIVGLFTGKSESLLGNPRYFQGVYVLSGIWQGMGYGAIVYLSALSGINQELYEAACIDGAGRWKQTLHVTLPGLLPTIVIMLIMRTGSIMSVSYQKIILLYSPATYETADVITSYVYRIGLAESSEFSYATAIGLFNSVINLAFVIGTNYISRRATETSLW